MSLLRVVVSIVVFGGLAACGESTETSGAEQQVVSPCTVTIAAPPTAVYGNAITMTPTASCPSGAPDVRWYRKIGTAAFVLAKDYRPAGPESFETTGTAIGTHQFYALVRTQGSAETAVKSNTISVSVADTVPSCTGVVMTAPTRTTIGRAGFALPVAASVTCPSGTTGEYRIDYRLSTTPTFTSLPDYTSGASTWTPPAAGSYYVRASARSVGAHVASQVSSVPVLMSVVAADVNRAPVATNDVATLPKNGSTTVDVAANDRDADGDPFTVAITVNPAHGTATLAGSQITFVPVLGYVGSDAITYSINDGHGGTATGRLTLTITAPPNTCTVALAANPTKITQGTPVRLTATATCGGPSSPIEYQWYSRPGTTGTFTTIAPWSATPVLDAATPMYGTFQFVAVARTPSAQGQSPSVTVTVIENVPQCTAAAVTVPKRNAVLTLAVPTTLTASATCPAGAAAEYLYRVRRTTTPTWTELGTYVPGSTSWTPPSAGAWYVTVLARSQGAHTTQATSPAIAVTVNDPNRAPVANNDQATFDQDVGGTLNVLANDTDFEGDPLSVVGFTLPNHGTVVVASDGTTTFHPTAGYVGNDNFLYYVSDGHHTSVANVWIILRHVNHAPVAVADTALTYEDQQVLITPLANDTDSDGDALSLVAAAATHGAVTVNGSHGAGTLLYEPGAGFHGVDTISYTISDGNGATASGTITATVTETARSRMAAGFRHTCAIRTDDSLYCWGANGGGQLGDGTTTQRDATRIGADHWLRVALGDTHTCGIRDNGSLWCWGSNQYGQLGTGDGAAHHTPTQVSTGPWEQVVAGWISTCAIRTDGSLWCWGDQFGSSPTRVGLEQWASVTRGHQHTCGTRLDGSLWCWGNNDRGQLGDGTTTARTTPVQIGNASWSMVRAGDSHTCGLTTDGAAYCWGRNSAGAVGDGGTTDALSPSLITPNSWASIDARNDQSCAVRIDHAIWCWGAGRTSPALSNIHPRWQSIALGGTHACATSLDDMFWCWGDNSSHQINGFSPATVPATDPQWNLFGPVYTELVAANGSTCAIRDDDSMWCWGENVWGQLGDGTTTRRLRPTQIGAGNAWLRMSIGRKHGCAIRTDRSLWCWGWNGDGELGVGTQDKHYTPTQVGTDKDWMFVSASGLLHTCAVKTDKSLWCWGSNAKRQLGDGTTAMLRTTPTRVAFTSTTHGSGWNQFSTGETSTCATRDDGSLWCWGYQWSGGSWATPTQIGSDTNWGWIAAGGDHACGTQTDGTLWCFGSGAQGSLGDGSGQSHANPLPVGGNDWTSVATSAMTGSSHTCATKSDPHNSVWCWGVNRRGAFGNGELDSYSPVPVRANTRQAWLVVVGDDHTCALIGTNISCFGSNGSGELGDGTQRFRLWPHSL